MARCSNLVTSTRTLCPIIHGSASLPSAQRECKRLLHRPPVLPAQVLAVLLRHQATLALRLNLGRHVRVARLLLLQQHIGLLDLDLALLVQVRLLQLLLQIAQLLALLTDALDILRLPLRLDLALGELDGKPLVLIA